MSIASPVTGNARRPTAAFEVDPHHFHNLYQTPPEATRAFIKAEAGRLPEWIWEPACGLGAIARELRAAGYSTSESDLVAYVADQAVYDFLDVVGFFEGEQPPAIVTNPPYKHANAFVLRAVKLAPYVAMLLPLSFLHGERRARRQAIEASGLARVYVFRERLPDMHRESWTGPKERSQMNFAWFVWERAHRGPPTIHRISWKEE